MKERLTAVEVANLLRINASTVYKLLKRGELQAFKDRGDWRFDPVQIEEWITSRMQWPEGLPTPASHSVRSRTRSIAGPHP